MRLFTSGFYHSFSMGIPLRNMRSQGRKDKGSNDEIIVNYQTVRREPFYPKRSKSKRQAVSLVYKKSKDIAKRKPTMK